MIITDPAKIEEQSLKIITEELGGRVLEAENAAVIKRVIHCTADFEYADKLYFSPGVAARALSALEQSATIITDTNMALAGINKAAAGALGVKVKCFIADEDVATEAKKRGCTRAMVAMQKAASLYPNAIIAVGNAPTALLELAELIRTGAYLPSLVIAVPVGFVNVVEAKEEIIDTKIPCIAARGRKGGSNVAAAIVNALMYSLYTR